MARSRKKIGSDGKTKDVGFIDTEANPDLLPEMEEVIVKEKANGKEEMVHESSGDKLGGGSGFIPRKKTTPAPKEKEKSEERDTEAGKQDDESGKRSFNPEFEAIYETQGIETGEMEVSFEPPVDAMSKNRTPSFSDVQRVQKLNECATTILECLPPGVKEDFLIAAKDYQIADIGVYFLGIINRLYKMVDYYNPDIEPEWDRGLVGYDQELYCNYCHKKILKPKNIKQLFCSNLCAKHYRDKNRSGVVYPSESLGLSEEEIETRAWEKEQQRLGAM